jgi:hypothetical protein
MMPMNANVNNKVYRPWRAEPPDEKALATAKTTQTTISSTAAKDIVWIPIGSLSKFIEFNNVAKTGNAEKPKPEASRKQKFKLLTKHHLVVFYLPINRIKAVLLATIPSFNS